jgi:tripartite-type tricarboxylate transporter receptor subunit TctC
MLDVSNVLTINPDVMNVKTLKEFVELVKANPGKYNYASTGNGAGTHMAFAEFNSRLGLNMVHVPYKGGPEAITSVVRGETCCIMNQVQTVLPHYKAGKVRLLGVTTASAWRRFPRCPPSPRAACRAPRASTARSGSASSRPRAPTRRSSTSSMAR